jgi:hypothetical protein
VKADQVVEAEVPADPRLLLALEAATAEQVSLVTVVNSLFNG